MIYVTLRNGYQVPAICYGTDIVDYRGTARERVRQNIKYFLKKVNGKDIKKNKKDQGIIICCKNAIDNDCQFFDTSRAYGGSEKMLHDALKSRDRNSYYICTKLDNYSQLHDIPARNVLMESMKQLGVDYIDLYLIHWPVKGKYLGYWKQLEALYKEGLVKAIGVSNCKVHHLEEIEKIAEIIPMVNEIELHPLLSEVTLREYCKQKQIQIMAYSSTARMDFRLKASRRLSQVCIETGRTLSQIILRWHIQNGVIPIFNSSSLAHFKENLAVFNFELTEEQMTIIDSININSRTRYDSDNCEWDRL